jgi:hypothetical protein
MIAISLTQSPRQTETGLMTESAKTPHKALKPAFLLCEFNHRIAYGNYYVIIVMAMDRAEK